MPFPARLALVCVPALLALPTSPFPLPALQVRPGIEVLLSDSLHLVRGKRVGLITNHSGRDRNGTSSIDLLHRAPDVRLTAIFGPEHGVRGTARDGQRIASSIDSATGVTVHSLYGRTLVPTPAMVSDIDVLVYDIQDVGARPYTYISTMGLAAAAAAAAKKPFIVLDRPNPIRGDRIEGGMLDTAFRSFEGRWRIPLRYGLTPGELVRYLVGTRQLAADVTVIPMSGYRRSAWFDETGFQWVNPSPNVRSVEAALLYPGIVFFEATNLSVGRGTEAPFHLVGAPWLTDAGAIARELNAKRLPGVRFDSTSRLIPAGEMRWGGRRIPMIRITVTDRNALRSVELGAHMLRAVYRRHPREWRWIGAGIERLSGSRALRTAVERGTVDALLARWRRQSATFERAAEPYRLYPR